MRKFQIAPFGRLVSSIDGRLIADHEASDMQDVKTGDGSLVNRYGWQNFEAAQTGFTANYVLAFLKGLNSSDAKVEEYVTVETLSGNTNPYSRHVTTGVATLIKDGVTTIDSLNAGRWNYERWKSFAFFWNNSDSSYPLVKHTIGDATSWTPIKNPDDPTVRLAMALVKNTVDNTTLNYREVDWTGVDPAAQAGGDITYTGVATATGSTQTGKTLRIKHTGTGAATIQIELDGGGGGVPGLQDWQFNDVFYLKITNEGTGDGSFGWDPTSLKMITVNDDTSDTQELELVALQQFDVSGNYTSVFMFKYPKGHNRALRTGTKKIEHLKFEYNITFFASATNAFLRFEPFLVGCIHPEHFGLDRADALGAKIRLLYYWKNSTTGDLTGFAPDPQELNFANARGEYRVIGGIQYPMGIAPRMSGQNGASTDQWVLATARNDDPLIKSGQRFGPARISATYADSALDQYYSDTRDDHIALPLYKDLDRAGGLKEDEILCAEPHLGHMVWGVKGGLENIQHSQVGSPLGVFDSNDIDPGDDGRPQNYTLSGNEGENPVQMHSFGEVLLILGTSGVYVQSGEVPSRMTFIKRVGSYPGTAGINASAVWQSDDGQPGVVYLSADLETVNFVSASPVAAGVFDPKPVEVSGAVRGKIKSHLFGTTAPTAGDIYVRIDRLADALWIIYQDKAMVLRKPAQTDGKRHWEPYAYTNDGNWVQWDLSQEYGIRAMRSSGEFDEVEYDNSDNKSPIEGADRDGGNAVKGFWENGERTGENTRTMFVEADRDDLTDTPTITATSTRTTSSKTIATGKRKVKFGITQQGTEHKVKVTLTDNSSPIRRLIVWFTGAGQRSSA